MGTNIQFVDKSTPLQSREKILLVALLALLFEPVILLADPSADYWYAWRWLVHGGIALVLGAGLLRRKVSRNDLLLAWGPGYVMGASVLALLAVTVLFSLKAFGSFEGVSPWIAEPTDGTPVMQLIHTTFGFMFMALVREAVFRGLLLTTMERRGLTRAGHILGAAFLFGLLYWPDGGLGFAVCSASGAIFWFIARSTRSIAPGVTANYLISLLLFLK